MTNLKFYVNEVDATKDYDTEPTHYKELDLTLDYFIWTAGSDDVKDGVDEPGEDELNEASTIIHDTDETQVAYCLMYDDSADELREVIGMGANSKFVFCVRFDGDTASEPRLEAWDDDTHTTIDKHCLGDGIPANSMLKSACTTFNPPGASWAKAGGTHTELAGGSNYLLLNGGTGAIILDSGETYRELYYNLAIVLEGGDTEPGAFTFVSTIRFTYN